MPTDTPKTNKLPNKAWTIREEKQLTQLYPLTPNRELAGLFCVGTDQLKLKAFRMGLKKAEGYKMDPRRKTKRKLSEQEKAFIARFAPTTPSAAIAQRLGRKRDVIYKALQSKWFTQRQAV